MSEQTAPGGFAWPPARTELRARLSRLTATGGSASSRHPHDGPRVLDRGAVLHGKAYVLLVFAGIWALLEGVGDIVRAFDLRVLNREA